MNPAPECLEMIVGMIAHPEEIEYYASLWFPGARGLISLPGFE